MNAYDKRVRELEAQGLTTSDAQGAADAEILKAKRHTPGPWYHSKLGNNADQWAIIDNTGRTIGLSYHGEANAEFIVRACNAHDDLLAVARDALTHSQLLGSGQQPLLSNSEMCELLGTAIAKATYHK